LYSPSQNCAIFPGNAWQDPAPPENEEKLREISIPRK